MVFSQLAEILLWVLRTLLGAALVLINSAGSLELPRDLICFLVHFGFCLFICFGVCVCGGYIWLWFSFHEQYFIYEMMADSYITANALGYQHYSSFAQALYSYTRPHIHKVF